MNGPLAPPRDETGADAWRRHPSWGRVPELELGSSDWTCTRLVVVSAHPEDESLGAGGLIVAAASAGIPVYVVLLTAGEASQKTAATPDRQALAKLRLSEMETALAALAPEAPLVFLGASDGQVEESEKQITSSLVELIGEGPGTLVAAPWRHDGHPDHDAAGRAAAEAARRTGAHLVEYLVRFWPRTSPDDAPWDRLRHVHLDAAMEEAKAEAIRSHVSQVSASLDQPGGTALLPGHVLAHFAGPLEHYVVEPEPEPDEQGEEGRVGAS